MDCGIRKIGKLIKKSKSKLFRNGFLGNGDNPGGSR
jgi:hypothetical protein